MRSHWPRQRILVVLSAVATLTTGCLGLGSRPTVSPPILTVPEAPPRVVAIYPVEPEPEPETPQPPSEDVGEDSDTQDWDEFVEQTESSRPPLASAPPPAPVVETTDEDEGEDPQLQPQLISAEQELTRVAVRQTLAAATRLLTELERNSLDSAGRAQFDTAQRFLQQARTALGTDNIVFAYYLGQKAEALAAGL